MWLFYFLTRCFWYIWFSQCTGSFSQMTICDYQFLSPLKIMDQLSPNYFLKIARWLTYSSSSSVLKRFNLNWSKEQNENTSKYVIQSWFWFHVHPQGVIRNTTHSLAFYLILQQDELKDWAQLLQGDSGYLVVPGKFTEVIHVKTESKVLHLPSSPIPTHTHLWW